MSVKFDRSAQNFANSRGLHTLSQETLSKMDTNKDGSISLNEAASASLSARLDTDGKVDVEEQARLNRLLGNSSSTNLFNTSTNHSNTSNRTTNTSRTSSTQTPFQKLLADNPSLKKNQDLINFFMRRNDNNWGQAVSDAKQFGVKLGALTKNRQGRIQTNTSNTNDPTNTPSRTTNTTPSSPTPSRTSTRRSTGPGLHIKPELLSRLDSHDRNKMEAWSDLVNNNLNKPTEEKLQKANAFFNSRLIYASDRQAWGEKDYWATPYESLEKGGGDCDDFAIAKYVTLRKMGIPKQDLKLAYVYLERPGRKREAHLVLLHQPPGTKGTVLDNFNKSLKSPAQRKDLRPVFTFNENGLWMSSGDNSSKRLSGTTDNLKKWQSVQDRLKDQGML